MKKNKFVENPRNMRPNVVLLDTGASLTAFPNGDKNGKMIPS